MCVLSKSIQVSIWSGSVFREDRRIRVCVCRTRRGDSFPAGSSTAVCGVIASNTNFSVMLCAARLVIRDFEVVNDDERFPLGSGEDGTNRR